MSNEAGITSSSGISEELRAFFRRHGTGWRVHSSAKRSVLRKMEAKAAWAKRREKYGPSGKQQRSYKLWLEERGKKLPDELKV